MWAVFARPMKMPMVFCLRRISFLSATEWAAPRQAKSPAGWRWPRPLHVSAGRRGGGGGGGGGGVARAGGCGGGRAGGGPRALLGGLVGAGGGRVFSRAER